jgi:hypothetical protein
LLLFLTMAPLMLTAPAANAASLDGAWSGSGFVKPKSGEKENVRCRVRYNRQTDKVYGVVATCATPSNKIHQTGTLLKVNDDRYVGDFYNGQFDISGRVRVIVNGSRQTVTFSSGSGSGRMELRRQ